MRGRPGFRLIGAIGRLVPWPQRAEWVEEWRAELAHGYDRQIGRGSPAWLAALSMRLRCSAAVGDALWLRRRNGGSSMLYSDVKTALRGIQRRPAFAASIIVTMALGIGGTTAMFSVIDPLMLRPLPYPGVDRLVEIHTVHPSGRHWAGLDVEVWKTLQGELTPRVFDRFEAGAPNTVVVTGAGEPSEVRAYGFTPGAFPLLGARPLLGRLFTESDAIPGAPHVALLRESLWRNTFFADPGVVGRSIALDGKQFTVIGVLPESFKYPDGTVALWFPLRMADPIWPVNGFEAVSRLRAGVPHTAAQAQLDAFAPRGNDQPLPYLWHLSVQPIENTLNRGVAKALLILAGAVACVLLIACVNAANLLLVHSTGRQTELAVRRSLGATSVRLFRQLVTESLLLALTGGLLGVLIAYAGVRLIVGMLPELLARDTQATIGVDGRVLAFSVALSLLTGVVFGAGPALRAARNTRLMSSNRNMTASAAVRRAGGTLVVIELALSMMLLVGAGLLIRSFVTLLAVDPGYRPQNLVVLRMNLRTDVYDSVRGELFYTALKERLRALPGVQGVSVSDGVPPRPSSFESGGLTLETDDGDKRPIGELRLPNVIVDDDYFDVLGIPIVEGRAFNSLESRAAPLSAIVDPDLARLLWPGRSAIGRRFRLAAEQPWLTVVGIAGDVKLTGPDDRAAPYSLYYSASQQTPWRYRSIAVRTRGAVGSLPMDIRGAVQSLDPAQPILDITPAESFFGDSLQRQRFLLILMSVFTAIAVVLAAIGVYGVISYVVAQRTREIGLRIALGATPVSMVAVVLGGGLSLALIGGAIGLAAALALSRFLTSMLFGVQPTDAATLSVVGMTLGAVAGFAALLPAIRAGRVSPLQALRVD